MEDSIGARPNKNRVENVLLLEPSQLPRHN
jgi:hypothetical protein